MKRTAVLRALLAGGVLLFVGTACARAVAPRGGDVPEEPLQVLRTSPDTFATIEPFDDAIRIDFDRRVSEQPTDGQLSDAVLVSPRTGEVEVRHRRRGLEIEMEGGFRERTVYRVTLLPTVQDLWQNRLERPFDLFFSTGPELEPNVLGGIVLDRLTGEETDGVRVEAIPEQEGATHATVTDSTGIFTFPHLPAGGYRILAYEDQNRNREPDFPEPRDELEVELARGDTLVVDELRLLAPDTTPAVVEDASAFDSTSVRVGLDDALDPEVSLEGVRVVLRREDGEAPGVREVLHPHEWEAFLAAREEAEPDPEDPEELEEEPPPPAEPGQDEPPLPERAIHLVLDGPLEPGVEYLVTVEGVTNIAGVPGGGGEARVEGPERAEPPEADPPEPDPSDTIPPPAGRPPPGSALPPGG